MWSWSRIRRCWCTAERSCHKVLITFNYKEGTQTVTFGEAAEVASEGNGSDLNCFAAPRKTSTQCVLVFLFRCGRGLEQHGPTAGGATKAPVGLLLVRGFQPVGMSTGRPAVHSGEMDDLQRGCCKIAL
ncbi:MAG: hypothetical protein EGR99_02760 [Faecalibacterium sp.]|nr:hypothetical protein [Faecalibacterium sp.]